LKGQKELETFGRRNNEKQELLEEYDREQGTFGGSKEEELRAVG
jgi:hypothetical protein